MNNLIIKGKHSMKIVIDGSPGAGKTFYLDKLAKDGFLVHMHASDVKKTPFCHHLNKLLTYVKSTYNKGKVNLYEMSPHTLKHVYCPVLLEEKNIDEEESNILCEYIDQVKWIPDVIIYLYCDPTICFERSNKLTLESLKKYHLWHEITLDELNCQIPIYKINSQEDPQTVYKNILSILSKYT